MMSLNCIIIKCYIIFMYNIIIYKAYSSQYDANAMSVGGVA